MPALASLALTVLTATASVTVQGDSPCPTPAEVERRLRPLLADRRPAAGGAPDQLHLSRAGSALTLTLLGADGRLLGTRTLDGAHPCPALAEAAAVIVASWRSDAASRPFLAAEAPPPAGEPGVATSVVETSPSAGASPGASGDRGLDREGPSWGIAAGGGVALASGAPVASALVTVAHAPVPRIPLAGRLAVAAEGRRTRDVPGGELRWQRWAVELGPQVGGSVGRAAWSAHLALAGAFTRLEGRGLTDPRSHTDLGLGVGGGLRLSLAGGSPRPFLEAGGRLWPTRVVAYQAPTGRETSLPQAEVALTLGIALGR